MPFCYGLRYSLLILPQCAIVNKMAAFSLHFVRIDCEINRLYNQDFYRVIVNSVQFEGYMVALGRGIGSSGTSTVSCYRSIALSYELYQVFTPKTHQMFSIHTTPEKFESENVGSFLV